MDVENPRAVSGDNAPPDPLLTEASERVDNANRWLKERGDWEKWTLEEADKVNFFLGQITATFDALDGRRLDEGRDFKKKQDAIYKDPLALLTLSKDKLVPLRRAWLRREDDRIQEERRKAEAAAEQARQEAEAARLKAEKAATAKGGDPLRAELAAQQAAAKAEEATAAIEQMPDRARIKGTFSTTAKSLTDYWSAEIVDLAAAFKHYNAKNNPNKSILTAVITEAIQRIANSEAKRVKDEAAGPPGITFKKERK